jgi:transcriptional regulator with XRE-family HTH domain
MDTATITAHPRFGLPDRIRRARLAAGYATQEDLAAAIHRSSAVVSKWERGVSEPKFHDVVAISQATHVPLDFFAEAFPWAAGSTCFPPGIISFPANGHVRGETLLFDADHPDITWRHRPLLALVG